MGCDSKRLPVVPILMHQTHLGEYVPTSARTHHGLDSVFVYLFHLLIHLCSRRFFREARSCGLQPLSLAIRSAVVTWRLIGQ